jgi:hypothetical protein
MTSYLNAVTRTYGYQMTDRKEPQGRQCKRGFIPAEEYLRTQALCASVLTLATYHACFDSKRVTRAMANLVAGYHLRKNQTHRNLQAVA